jgi:hypothetical protein
LRKSSPVVRDAAPRRLRFDFDMNSAQRAQFTLDIDVAAEPITGAVGDGGGQRVEFSGWLGFAAALEELLSPLRGLPVEPALGPPAGRPQP